MAVYKNQDKAKVGDYVKIIKKVPYKHNEAVEIGDIGIVNYVAGTGKYSVHIDGKQNPSDIAYPQQRSYGELYDFWIPCNCCEVVNNFKFKIGEKVRINYPQGSKIHNCCGTIYKPDESIRNLERYIVDIFNVENNIVRVSLSVNCLEKVSDTTYEEELTKKCLFENADALDTYYLSSDIDILFPAATTVNTASYSNYIQDVVNNNLKEIKESEETKMKEIKNQQVVDLYFKRKQDAINKALDNAQRRIVEADKNHIFINQLKEQYNTYVEENEIKNVVVPSFSLTLPLTVESNNEFKRVSSEFNKQLDELNNLKEEIIAMLSGCVAYEQEMEILKSYGIVDENHKMTNFETN